VTTGTHGTVWYLKTGCVVSDMFYFNINYCYLSLPMLSCTFPWSPDECYVPISTCCKRACQI